MIPKQLQSHDIYSCHNAFLTLWNINEYSGNVFQALPVNRSKQAIVEKWQLVMGLLVYWVFVSFRHSPHIWWPFETSCPCYVERLNHYHSFPVPYCQRTCLADIEWKFVKLGQKFIKFIHRNCLSVRMGLSHNQWFNFVLILTAHFHSHYCTSFSQNAIITWFLT